MNEPNTYTFRERPMFTKLVLWQATCSLCGATDVRYARDNGHPETPPGWRLLPADSRPECCKLLLCCADCVKAGRAVYQGTVLRVPVE
jgi:hypothetical protein